MIDQEKKKAVTIPLVCPNCGGNTLQKRDPASGQFYYRCLGSCKRSFKIYSA